MRLPRRTVYALMVALLCANILVRFPRTSHETGIDSFFIHNLATSISEAGRISWVLNPLGYFGWYPLSYPTAAPLLISGISQVVGFAEEATILVLSLLYGIVGALASFAMARAFRRDDAFALIVGVLFSLAPRFMSFTMWSASSRNLFMVLTPVFVWLLVRSYGRPSMPNLLLLFSVVVVMIATHRLTILLAVVVIAFLAAYVFILLNRVTRIRFPKVLLSQKVRRWTPRLALLGILLVAVFMLTGTAVLEEYSQGEVCSGDGVGDQLCNLGVSITRSVGLALPFALVGVMELVRQNGKGFLEAFLVFSLLALIPTLFLRQYTGFYILPFLALFGALGVLAFVRFLANYPRVRNAIAVASVLTISGFSFAVLGVELERGTSLADATYSTALYLNDLPEGNFVANDGLLGIRIASLTGRGGLPVGGAGTTHQSPELLILGAYNASDVFSKEQRIPIWELTIEDDSPFILLGINARDDWDTKIMKSSVDAVSQRVVDRYRLSYYLENDDFQSAYLAFGNIYDARRYPELVVFPLSVYASRYKIFDGTRENLYFVWTNPGTP